MKRSRIIALVLVAVVVVVLAVVLRDAADERPVPPEPDREEEQVAERDVPEERPATVAQILPADTVAYLTVSDPASLLLTAEATVLKAILVYVGPVFLVIVCSFLAATVSTVIARKREQKIPNLIFLGLMFCVSTLAGWIGGGWLMGFSLKTSQLGMSARIVFIGIGSYAATLLASALLVQLRGALKQGTWVVTLVPWGVASLILFSFLTVPVARSAAQFATKVRCSSNLRGIAQGVQVWSLQHGDDGTFYPPSLQALLDDDVIAVPEVFICPASGTEPQPDRFVSDYDSVLDRAEFRIRADDFPASLIPFAWHKENFHGDGRVVVFFDQRTRFVDEDEFEELMQKVDNWIRENQPE